MTDFRYRHDRVSLRMPRAVREYPQMRMVKPGQSGKDARGHGGWAGRRSNRDWRYMSAKKAKPAILLVDDEPNVLQGLRRSMRALRDDWDMSWVEGGAEAIAAIRSHHFDAVVSDMRMPGRDGAAVLEAAAQANPGGYRVILSGFSDRGAIGAVEETAHRYIAKPCSGEDLVAYLRTALALRGGLPTARIRDLIGRAPDVFGMARPAVRQDECLALAQSASFNLDRPIEDHREAVELLRPLVLRALCHLTALTKGDVTDEAGEERYLRSVVMRALVLGGAARRICLHHGFWPEDVERATAAALLCHVGTAVLRSAGEVRYQASLDMISECGDSVLAAERRVFGATHVDIGVFLSIAWGFPDEITALIAGHHAPRQVPGVDIRPMAAVHLAQFARMPDRPEWHDLNFGEGMPFHGACVEAVPDRDFLEFAGF